MFRTLSVPGRWLVHAYYNVCPYAPDGSNRILVAGGDVGRQSGEVIILSADGRILDRFGEGAVEASFYHTGRWQTWSPDAQYVYYTTGRLKAPQFVRRHLDSGQEEMIGGDLEGAPPGRAPLLSGLLGMLHAAGAGDGSYAADRSPVPFEARDRHGLFRYQLAPPSTELAFSVAEALAVNPFQDEILAADDQTRARFGTGLSLMLYCVRWSPDCSRLLFYFGNHLAFRGRGEIKIGYVMTAQRDLTEMRIAVDLSFGKPGLHWSWQPDNEHLIGYGPHPDDQSRMCLAEVRFDGSNYRKLSDHASGGHPSASPTNRDLLVTDEVLGGGSGAVTFVSRATGDVVEQVQLPKFHGTRQPIGRGPDKTDHHPAFHPSGDRVIANSLPGRNSVLVEIEAPR